MVLIAEFAEYYGITTTQAAKYLSQYKVLELFDRQYGCLHTQSYCLQRARPLRLLSKNGGVVMITLYHGSNVRITGIDLNQCSPYKNFCKAFYISDKQEQTMDVATARVDIFGGEPVVNAYRFDETLLSDGTLLFKTFDGYTEEWADFVYQHRDETIVPPYERHNVPVCLLHRSRHRKTGAV